MAKNYQYPSVRDVQDYARAAIAYPSQAPMTQGASLAQVPQIYAPRGLQKPHLRMMSNGEIRIKGVENAAVFFAPLNPLQPVAQFPAAQAMRPWDYPIGFNTRVLPRSGYSIGFPLLKALADGCDLLRILIERVKDKILAQE